ncbi:uncharacterized protein LOC109708273 [Ananas comosus]|uniref:Uncharacterized protein LOC109708273 n=1 Tax=Ananas comosus TaxID=4615 RepID=A0A199VWC3_ANACO|nr:uncharacterized protein LOC109708273 [Ananas comosus]OAY81293.1 hypothetical protein ACMD2_10835 [Ananas comosus]
MEGLPLTESEIAGFGVGALLLCATVAAPKVDAFIAASQRRSLGMCKRCGDLRMIACSECRGVGSIKKGGPLVRILDDFYESLGEGSSPTQLIACTKCRSKGRTVCPECSKLR